MPQGHATNIKHEAAVRNESRKELKASRGPTTMRWHKHRRGSQGSTAGGSAARAEVSRPSILDPDPRQVKAHNPTPRPDTALHVSITTSGTPRKVAQLKNPDAYQGPRIRNPGSAAQQKAPSPRVCPLLAGQVEAQPLARGPQRRGGQAPQGRGGMQEQAQHGATKAAAARQAPG